MNIRLLVEELDAFSRSLFSMDNERASAERGTKDKVKGVEARCCDLERGLSRCHAFPFLLLQQVAYLSLLVYLIRINLSCRFKILRMI
jgi:hypothetical protein